MNFNSKHKQMKNFIQRSILVFLISVLFTGCSMVGDIFKAGMGVGIFVFILIIVIVIFVISKFFRKN